MRGTRSPRRGALPGTRNWDARLHSLVGGLPPTAADRWLRRLTTAADDGRLWMAAGALLAVRRGTLRRAAVRGAASMAVSSGLVNTALKPVVGRRRPDLGAHPVHRLLHEPLTTHSFPSGHASSAGAFVTAVALECPPAGLALAPLALAVGYSRVHVGVHYPGDVVAGLAVGAAVAVAGRRWWAGAGDGSRSGADGAPTSRSPAPVDPRPGTLATRPVTRGQRVP